MHKTHRPQMAAGPLPFPDVEPVFLTGERTLRAAAAAHRHLLTRTARLGEEAFGFTLRRLEENRRMGTELAACRSPAEAQAVVSKFLERAAMQYSEEAGLVASIWVDQTREAMEDVEREVDVAFGPESPSRATGT